MNLTSIGNTHGNLPSWKRFKTQYVATVAAVTLAASAAFVFAPSESPKTVAPAPRLSAAVVPQPKPKERQFFYIVSSETERVALLRAFNAAAQEDQPGVEFNTRDMDENNVPYSIFDLTAPKPATVPDAAVATSQASGADIMAGVLSTEYATWGVPQAESVAQPPFASGADIMAGVLSTEYATWGAPQAESVAQPRFASEADIMAGVLSTEYATWGAPR